MNIKMRIDPDQRAWYVATRANDLSNNQARMWQEYPSFPDEAFQVSTEEITMRTICLIYVNVMVLQM